MEITFVTNCDDWEGLYIDGDLILQDHLLDAIDVIRVIARNSVVSRLEVDYGWLQDAGWLPDNLADVRFA